MKEMTIKVYTTPTCPWCRKAKDFLKDKKIKYPEYDVSRDEKARREMLRKSNQLGVPVLDINGKIIIGFDPEEIKNNLRKSLL